MLLSEINRRSGAIVGAACLALALLVVVVLICPDPADAALRAAAGGGQGGGGGFARFISFVNRLADYAIPLGAAFGVLGLIWGGIQFQTGNPNAGRQLAMVGIGVAIVLLAKPILA